MADSDELQALTPIQQRAIIVVQTRRTVRAAALEVGVSERTLHRWLSEKRFRRVLEESRRMAFVESMREPQYLSRQAVDTLRKVMEATDCPTARVNAVRTVFDYAVRGMMMDPVHVSGPAEAENPSHIPLPPPKAPRE